MSDQLQTSNNLQESAVSNSQASSSCSIKRKCYKLFFSCFKNTYKGKSKEGTTNYNSNNYDYIVEKLVIKRVPFIFSGILTNASEIRNDNFIKDVEKPLIKMNTSETQSILYCSEDLNENTIPVAIVNKSMKVDSNTVISNEINNKLTLSTNYDARIIELINTLTSLHPDLKECEKWIKDPCCSNIHTPKSILARNTEQITPINNKEFGDAKSIIKSKNKQKIYYSRQHTYLNEFQGNDKEPFIQSDQGIFHSLKSLTKFIDPNQLNRENSNQKLKQIKNNSQHNQLALKNESKVLGESIINNNNTLDTALRWKITVKHFKSQ
ncbi:uncharacterized protein LOC114880699 isoform X2 [Osmia bicornis bicornis]|uniref:uncharacterized protein LOC114880699 isoform X2 n=1 Tax=Osmia bicornis bicornis TaxID=1437191 RepID=UPI0010F52BBA|nr:uncharacterized protein LOC114880699 isoform X2 [Osmia bicornis bicornis]